MSFFGLPDAFDFKAMEEVKRSEEGILNGVSTEILTKAERKQVLDLLTEFKELWFGEPRGLLKHVQHQIRVKSCRPVFSPPRRFTKEERAKMQQELEAMLKANVVRESHVSEVQMVPKKGWVTPILY